MGGGEGDGMLKNMIPIPMKLSKISKTNFFEIEKKSTGLLKF